MSILVADHGLLHFLSEHADQLLSVLHEIDTLLDRQNPATTACYTFLKEEKIESSKKKLLSRASNSDDEWCDDASIKKALTGIVHREQCELDPSDWKRLDLETCVKIYQLVDAVDQVIEEHKADVASWNSCCKLPPLSWFKFNGSDASLISDTRLNSNVTIQHVYAMIHRAFFLRAHPVGHKTLLVELGDAAHYLLEDAEHEVTHCGGSPFALLPKLNDRCEELRWHYAPKQKKFYKIFHTEMLEVLSGFMLKNTRSLHQLNHDSFV